MDSLEDLIVEEEIVLEACGEHELPNFGVIKQLWKTNPIPVGQIGERAENAVQNLSFENVPDGGEVAIGVGSRGIANLPIIVDGVVTYVKELGYNPFVFPAMGSHGGATGEGQREMLESLEITENRIGCEIRSSMDVVQVGTTEDRDVPVVADDNAVNADAIIPINRIKPHTDFDGRVESGLSKMLVIGMGKQRGAKIAHDWAVNWSLRKMIPDITAQLLDVLPVVGGVAIVEDQRDDTAIIEGIRPEGFLDREAELLEISYDVMPTLPFDDIDALVVDYLGKDISGQGMDTNVIGRRPFAINEPEPNNPNIKRIYARRLTETTHGNAMGIGSADFVHQNIAADLESSSSVINAITASTIRGVRLPPTVETDRAGVIASLSTLGSVSADDVRMLRVADTMHLSHMYASSSLVKEARDRADLEVVREPEPITFESGQFAAPSLRDT